ncbi:MAG: hypothetical protein MI861_14035 [Pirellulales bacterium]|nr:hypothetical protein [Pirellulales bacterium]
MMELDTLNCNCCGAPLEVSRSTNFVTCNHCSAQLHVRRTESSAFTEQLGKLQSNQDEMLEKLERLERDSELAKLDRQWESEKERYMVETKNGGRKLPSEAGSAFGMVAAAIFGVIWIFVTLSVFPPMALFGVVAIVMGAIASANANAKARDYRRAYQKYRRQRDDMLRD